MVCRNTTQSAPAFHGALWCSFKSQPFFFYLSIPDEARFSISSYTPSQNSTSTIQPYNSNLITRLTTSEANYSPTSTVDPMMAERMWEVIAEQSEWKMGGLGWIWVGISV